eukprot:COSAG05_NODE_1411_length_4958_cov_2.723400_8_plen_51_part_00
MIERVPGSLCGRRLHHRDYVRMAQKYMSRIFSHCNFYLSIYLSIYLSYYL